MSSSETVYVDKLCPTIPRDSWPYHQACHLLCSDAERLHEFAAEIGLKRSWFHDGYIPHYDLTVNMRRKALQQGAKDMNHLSREDAQTLMREFKPELFRQ